MRREVIYKDLSPTAAQEAALSMPELQPFSSFSDVLGTDSSPRPRWQTGERNAIILNGKSTPFTTQGQRFGIWSLAQSDDNLDIAVPPLEITFSGLESSTAFTLVFDDPASTYCTELNLKYYRGSDLLYESDYFPDSPSYACLGVVETYNRIIVQFRKLNFSGRYLKVQNILFGIIRVYGGDEVKSLRVFEKVDPTGQTLPINSSEFTALPDEDDELLYQKRQSVEIRFDGALVAQHYISKAQNHRFNNIDIIGVLDTMGDYSGGVYADDITAEQLILDIVNGACEVEIDTSLKNTPIRGWLPIKKRRDALAMVQFAIGAVIDTSRSDKIHVQPVRDDEPEEISVSRTYYAPSTEFEFPHTGIELIEYRLQENADDVKLFDEEIGAEQVTVNFRNPVWSFSIANGTLIETHPNYATFTGIDGRVTTLNGKEYELVETVKTKNNPYVTSITEEKIYRVTDQYLVNQDNSLEVADRLYDYYIKPRTVSAGIILKDEKPGDTITLNTPHDRTRAGQLEQIELIPGAKEIRAEVKIRAE